MEFFVKDEQGNYIPFPREQVLKVIMRPVKKGEQITSAIEAMGNFQKIVDKPVENFMVLYLNNANVVIGQEIISTGVEDQTAVYPKDIVRKALLKYASAIIIGHNHPSGFVSPSYADREITRKIKQCCDTFDIRLCDHIIVAPNSPHYSFRESGILM
jgi:DNA repair protein RadC